MSMDLRNPRCKMIAEYLIHIDLEKPHKIQLFQGLTQLRTPEFLLVYQKLRVSGRWVEVHMRDDGSWIIDGGEKYYIKRTRTVEAPDVTFWKEGFWFPDVKQYQYILFDGNRFSLCDKL